MTWTGSYWMAWSFAPRRMHYSRNLRRNPGGSEPLRLRTTQPEKRVLRELLPICRYIQTYYRLGRYISVRWIKGSQSYNTEPHQGCDYVTQGYYSPLAYLEATCAMHENEYLIWKLLNQGKVAYASEGIDAKKGTPFQSEPVVMKSPTAKHQKT